MYNFARITTFLISGVCLWIPPSVLAGGAFREVPADELKMTDEPKAPGAPAIYTFLSEYIDDQEGREEDYFRIKVLNEEGRKYADIEIPFVKRLWEIQDISARTIQPDGSIAEFHGTIHEKTIVKAKKAKLQVKTFALPDVRVGTVIEYFYTIKKQYAYDSTWNLSQSLFTKEAVFTLKKHPSYGIRWSYPIGLREGDEKPIKLGNTISLSLKNIPAFRTEEYMPPENALRYRVEFIYSNEASINLDPVSFWREQGVRWYEGFQKFGNEPGAMNKAVATIIADADSPEVKLQKLYARVQQIRNTTFDPQKSDQERKRENQKDPENVREVWKAGYGNSAAVNRLFIALARAAGFEADCVYVSSRSRDFFDPEMMNPSLLNAEVVRVKLAGKEIYLDPGAKFSPFGLLPWYETQVKGIRLDQNGGQWIETPTFDSASAKTERKAQLTLTEDGVLEGQLTITFTGLEAMEMRRQGLNEDDSSRKSILEAIVKNAVIAGSEVDLTNEPDWTSASNTMTAEYKLRVPGWAEPAGDRVLLPLGLFGAEEKKMFVHADRVHPVYFPYPYLTSDIVSISLPEKWTADSIPKSFNQDSKAIGYSLKAEVQGQTLQIGRTVRIDLVMVEKKQYEILRHFFQLMRTQDEQQAVFRVAR